VKCAIIRGKAISCILAAILNSIRPYQVVSPLMKRHANMSEIQLKMFFNLKEKFDSR